MAITVNEMKGGRTAGQGRDWTRTYTRRFRAVTDSPDIGPRTVAAAVGLQIGDVYVNSNASETDRGSFVMSISIAEEDAAEDGMSWICTYEYGPYDAAQWPENPLQKPVDVQWGFNPFTKVASEDINGNPVVNSANDYFDPPQEIDDDRMSLTIARNEAGFDPARAYYYKQAINTDTFLGLDPYTVKIRQISGTRIWDQYLSSIGQNNGFYWPVTYEFEFNPDKWIFQILDQGLRKLDSSTGKQAQILDENGIAITSPKLLDGNGNPIEPGTTPHFLEFHLYPELTFDGLDIQYPS